MSMIRRILVVCCYCCFGSITLLNAQQPAVKFDIASFRGRSGLVSVDIYLQFDRAQLGYVANKAGFFTKLAAVALLKQSGQIITFDQLEIVDQLSRSGDVSSGSFTRFITFDLTPGDYDLELAVTDDRGGEFDSTMQLQLSGYQAHTVGISSAVLATAIHPRKSSKQLQRRGFNIYPLATDMVGATDGLLWYYCELYGLTPEDTVAVQTVVTDSAGTIYTTSVITALTAGLVYPHWGALNPAMLVGGRYELRVTVQIGADTISTVHAFSVTAADTGAAESDSVGRVWDMASRRRLERIVSLMGGSIDQMRFIELDSLEQMNMLEEQASTLGAPVADSTTTVLEDWIERWQWIRNSDPGYRYSGRITAAGELVLLHGLPVTIDRHGPTPTHWGYQTWQYDDADTNFVVLLETGGAGITMLTGSLSGLIMRDDWQLALSRATDLAAYFAPPEAIVDSTAVAAEQEADAPAETMAEPEQEADAPAETMAEPEQEADAPAETMAEPELPVVEATVTDTTAAELPEPEVASPVLAPANVLDGSEIQAAGGASDTTLIDSTTGESTSIDSTLDIE